MKKTGFGELSVKSVIENPYLFDVYKIKSSKDKENISFPLNEEKFVHFFLVEITKQKTIFSRIVNVLSTKKKVFVSCLNYVIYRNNNNECIVKLLDQDLDDKCFVFKKTSKAVSFFLDKVNNCANDDF